MATFVKYLCSFIDRFFLIFVHYKSLFFQTQKAFFCFSLVGWCYTASPKVLKIFSHPQTRDQSQVVQNDKLSQESVETKIFVGGNGTFSHFFEKKLKKMWKKISKKKFFFTKICFSGLEKPYVQLLVLNFFSDFDLQKLIFGNFEEFGLFFEVF